jgi:hypothetical protein
MEPLIPYSVAAEELLLGTAAQESRLGQYVKQWPTGPALSIYQMESDTHDDIWNNYLAYRADLASVVRGFAAQHVFSGSEPGALSREMVGNIYYATAMARVHYRRVAESLPHAGNLLGMASYWKRFFNTGRGAGSQEEFMRNYHDLVLNGD